MGERHAFSALTRPVQPSAWARDLEYGGACGLTALILALAFTTVRPTPCRRQPEAPAPAWAKTRKG
jgi:hypothetical protein